MGQRASQENLPALLRRRITVGLDVLLSLAIDNLDAARKDVSFYSAEIGRLSKMLEKTKRKFEFLDQELGRTVAKVQDLNPKGYWTVYIEHKGEIHKVTSNGGVFVSCIIGVIR